MTLTKAQRDLLTEVLDWQHMGGYWTEDRAIYKRLERLRAKRALRYFSRRHVPFYNTFFEITGAGYAALAPTSTEAG